MHLELGEIDTARLEAVRKQFNAFTGKRWTLERFAAWLLLEALTTEEKAAAKVNGLRAAGLAALKGGVHAVH